MSQLPDQHYIEQVLSGDTRAYSILIERYKHMVFTLSMQMVRNREDAEEISQDTFIKAYKALKTFRGQAAFSTWLYRIAYRNSLDFLKSSQRKMASREVSLEGDYPLAFGSIEANGFEEDGQATLVKGAMEKLTEEDQVILTLYYYEELSLKEIAGIIGISINTAKVRLFRSRERLAKLLSECGINQKTG